VKVEKEKEEGPAQEKKSGKEMGDGIYFEGMRGRELRDGYGRI
jgi:hypothetical protein